MRILWISHTERVGGAELALLEGARALSVAGHSVHVVAPGEGELAARARDLADVHVCHHNRWAGPSYRRPAATRWMAYNLAVAAPRLAALAEALGVDVVLSNTLTTMAGGLAAQRAQIPHAWFIHEFGRSDHGVQFVFGQAATLAAMRRLARVSLVGSEALREHFAARLRGVQLYVARQSVEVPELEPPAHPASSGPLRLVVAGFMSDAKGQLDAVRAVGLLASAGVTVKLDLLGAGDAAFERRLRVVAGELRVADQ